MFCVREGRNRVRSAQAECDVNPNCNDCNFAHTVGNMVDMFHGKGWSEKDVRRIFGYFFDASSELQHRKDTVSDIINTRYPKQGV